MAKQTIGNLIRECLQEGKDTAAILNIVKATFPDAQTTSASVAWYRSKMKKDGASAAKAAPAAKAPKTAHPKVKVAPAAVTSALSSYTVRGVKSTTGTEGCGYECTLYHEGKKVATVVDTADGGPVNFYWADDTAKGPRVDVTVRDFMGKTVVYKGSPEEARFAAAVAAKGTYKSQYDGEDRYYDMDLVAEDMVNDVLIEKELDKLTKKGTRIAFVSAKNPGSLMTCAAAPTEENIKAYVYDRDGAEAKVLNTMERAKAIALIKSLQH